MKPFIYFIMIMMLTSFNKKDKLPQEFFKHWRHSFEEDKDNILYYRANYIFPRARSRNALEFKENGEYIDYQTGPTDRLEVTKGRWEYLKDYIEIKSEDGDEKLFSYEIISISDTLLMLKKLSHK